MTFEEFLKEKHARTYTGTDDAMPDAFDAWLEALGVDEWIAYGEVYKNKEIEAARQEGRDKSDEKPRSFAENVGMVVITCVIALSIGFCFSAGMAIPIMLYRYFV